MFIKSKKGFTLIESMMALAFVALAIAPMFTLQTTVFSTISSLANSMQQWVRGMQFMVIAFKQQKTSAKEFKLEKKEEAPQTILQYAYGPVSEKSSLSEIKGLYQQKVIAQYRAKDPHKKVMTRFVFKSEPLT